MHIMYHCPPTGVYVEQVNDDGLVTISGKVAKVRSATASQGIVVDPGETGLLKGSILHYNRGQHSRVYGDIFFVHESNFFAASNGDTCVPFPDLSRPPSKAYITTPFHELKGFSDEKAAEIRPLHHFCISPEKVDGMDGAVSVPQAVGSYKPRDSYDGITRPLSGIVLAVPSHPIDEDGNPFIGRIPSIGDRVWFSTLAWSGGTTTNDPYSTKGGLVTRWPGLMGLSDMHMGATPSGELYAIGDNGIAVEVSPPDGAMKGLPVDGFGSFYLGGDSWESIHGSIGVKSWISFKVTQGVNGGNTLAPAPWGWCIKIASRNLTGVSIQICDWPMHERRLQ